MHRFLSLLDEAWKAGYEFVKQNPILLKRIDINSVMPTSGEIMNDRRIREALATTIELRNAGAYAITDGAHQSRKGESDFYPTLEHSRLMNQILKDEFPNNFSAWEYTFNETCWGPAQAEYLVKGKNVLGNNIRFAPWELKTPSQLENLPPVLLVNKLQAKGHLVGYVQDAFASAHRGGNDKDTSMFALPNFFKQIGIPVFPSRSFVDEMRKFAEVNERINKSQKVVVALFGGKVKDYLDVLSVYSRYDHIEFLAGSILSMVFQKSKNSSISFGINEERFFKGIGQNELDKFAKHFDPNRV
ncbi:MAG: phosphoglycerate kinase, partial [Candidatus Thorarchaeota archaeon]